MRIMSASYFKRRYGITNQLYDVLELLKGTEGSFFKVNNKEIRELMYGDLYEALQNGNREVLTTRNGNKVVIYIAPDVNENTGFQFEYNDGMYEYARIEYDRKSNGYVQQGTAIVEQYRDPTPDSLLRVGIRGTLEHTQIGIKVGLSANPKVTNVALFETRRFDETVLYFKVNSQTFEGLGNDYVLIKPLLENHTFDFFRIPLLRGDNLVNGRQLRTIESNLRVYDSTPSMPPAENRKGNRL